MRGRRMAWTAIVLAGVLLAAGLATWFRAGDDGPGTGTAAAALGEDGAAASSSGLLQQEDERPWLGVMLFPGSGGLTIMHVMDGSPANAAGLLIGDIVKAVDGAEGQSIDQLRALVAGKKPGETMTLRISRDGQDQEVTVTLGSRPTFPHEAGGLLPELAGVPAEELFGHLLGGQFNLTDASGNPLTVAVEPGTVASLDAQAGTLTVNLNAGGSKTYNVEEDDFGPFQELPDLQAGDRVTIVSVNGDVRRVLPGSLPGLGSFPGFGHGPFGGRGFMDRHHDWSPLPEASPEEQPPAPGT